VLAVKSGAISLIRKLIFFPLIIFLSHSDNQSIRDDPKTSL